MCPVGKIKHKNLREPFCAGQNRCAPDGLPASPVAHGVRFRVNIGAWALH